MMFGHVVAEQDKQPAVEAGVGEGHVPGEARDRHDGLAAQGPQHRPRTRGQVRREEGGATTLEVD